MFDNHYEVFLADTRESQEINYSIRYKTYCEEMGFENKDDFPEEQEFDAHDLHSAHFIVRHKATGDWVGAMRLIFQNDQSLPIAQYCDLQVKIEANPAVELSRLCVIKDVRRRFTNFDIANELDDKSERKKATYNRRSTDNHQKINRSIIWGLINAVTEYCHSNDIETWYFITTSALAKVLRKGGCNMLNIGSPCSHHGERYPFKKDAVDTYHNETWRKDYTNGYRKFSEMAA